MVGEQECQTAGDIWPCGRGFKLFTTLGWTDEIPDCYLAVAQTWVIVPSAPCPHHDCELLEGKEAPTATPRAPCWGWHMAGVSKFLMNKQRMLLTYSFILKKKKSMFNVEIVGRYT